MPADWYMKTANSLHRGMIKITGGRFGWSAIGMSVVELTTIGAKSGQPRRVMLTSPLEEGDTVVVVASAGGNDNHPAWYHNILAHPEVEVVYRGKPKQKMHARVPRVRGLRSAMTDAERKLWWHLRELPVDRTHFRPQATIGPYFADFVCHIASSSSESTAVGMALARKWLRTQRERNSCNRTVTASSVSGKTTSCRTLRVSWP